MDFYVNKTKIGKSIEFESKPIMNKNFPSLEDLKKPMTLDFDCITGNDILDKILKDQHKREEEILNNVLKELEDGTIDRSIRMYYDCEFTNSIFSNCDWFSYYFKEDMKAAEELVNKKLNRKERRHNEKFEKTRYKRTRKGDKNFF